jgi:Meckel syndrome type 1 protein
VPAIDHASATANVDPFGAQALTAPSRPWPRAILPNFPAAGALTVDYGNGASTFYPFEPRLAAPAGDSASGQQDSTGEPAPPQP